MSWRNRNPQKLHVPLVIATLLAAAGGCGTASPGGMSGPTISGRMSPTPNDSLQSGEVLSRTQATDRAVVKHVLIAWGALSSNYGGKMDPRAKKRSRADAERLVTEINGKLAAGAPIEAMMIEHSNDQGSRGGEPIAVTPAAKLVTPFKNLSLRLSVGEVGTVLTDFGWHIVKRIK